MKGSYETNEFKGYLIISGKNSAKSNARLLFVVHVSSERGIGYAGTRGVNEIRG